MGIHKPTDDRILIPRWRDFQKTTNTGELSSLSNPNRNFDFEKKIKQKIDQWEKNKNTQDAIYIVNQSITTNTTKLATEPAKYLLKNKKLISKPLTKLCESIIEGKESINNNSTVEKISQINGLIQSKISDIRRSISFNERNPIKWVELSRWHLVNGHFERAERAMLVAINLAPTNRYVVRSAVRFFIHKDNRFRTQEEPSLKKAKKILSESQRLKNDPWLISAEIVVSDLLGKTSNFIKKGQDLIRSDNFSKFDLTELASTIGTEELKSGSYKNSFHLFAKSLLDPTENAIAQAEWASHHLTDLEINYAIRNPHEALAKHYKHNDELEKAYEEGLLWCIDQPFSSDPAIFTSDIATDTYPPEKAYTLFDFGLRSNPDNFTLLNNKAYLKACELHGEDAEIILSKIAQDSLDPKEKTIYTATKGMIAYSKGYFEKGNSLYENAKDYTKDKKLKAWVEIYHFQAQKILGLSSNKTEQEEAQELVKKFSSIIGEKELKKQMKILEKRRKGEKLLLKFKSLFK
ncbi:MAG: hypothetical protein WD361_11130 [Gracilimonas sp.]